MDPNRNPNGRFASNNKANQFGRHGRAGKRRTPIDEVAQVFEAKVAVTEDGKRKRISKLAANLKQVANQGAQGDLKAAKMSIDFAIKAQKEREPPPAPVAITQNDKAIVMRFIARLKLTEITPENPDEDATA